MVRPTFFWSGVLAIALVKLSLHLYANTLYDFHRDGLLYMALGGHPDWGYWSNPPLIGWIGWLARQIGGGPLWVVRLFPTLASCGLVVLSAAMAREMGAGRYGQLLAAIGILVAPAYLRSGMLFQPVVFDILGWGVLSFWVLRYLRTENPRVLPYFGATFGLFFLNKYMVLFFLAALVPALALTSVRRVLWSREALWAAGIALLIMLPNVIWQVAHHFPVVSHMRALEANQLVHVSAGNFLKDQLLMCFTAALLWIPGLWWLWNGQQNRFRAVFFLYIGVIALMLLLKGKAYYTLGIYPVLIAAGGVFWEKTISRIWLRAAVPLAMAGLQVPMLPLALPMLPPEQMVQFCARVSEKYGLDGLTRWEDGRTYPLPQDYADMLGWAELGQGAVKAYRMLPPGTPVLIYAENYGLAGAVDYYGAPYGLPPAVSFSDTYLLWAPDHTDAKTLIYINDELGQDIQALFSDIQPIDSISNPLAREHGATVYLCRQPRRDVDSLWHERVTEVRAAAAQ